MITIKILCHVIPALIKHEFWTLLISTASPALIQLKSQITPASCLASLLIDVLIVTTVFPMSYHFLTIIMPIIKPLRLPMRTTANHFSFCLSLSSVLVLDHCQILLVKYTSSLLTIHSANSWIDLQNYIQSLLHDHHKILPVNLF